VEGFCQWLEQLIHLVPHGRAHRVHAVVYLQAESRLRGIERLIQVALQGRANWLDHEISLPLGNVLDLIVQLIDHRLERTRHQWSQASISVRGRVCLAEILVHGGLTRNTGHGLLPSGRTVPFTQKVSCTDTASLMPIPRAETVPHKGVAPNRNLAPSGLAPTQV
jgi:hypothetical protein